MALVPPTAPPALKLSCSAVIMLSASASYCLITSGVVRVSGQQGPIATSTFQRGVDTRSDGMPEPQCKALTDYAAYGGEMLRRATRDTAAVLAAWIVNHTLENL